MDRGKKVSTSQQPARPTRGAHAPARQHKGLAAPAMTQPPPPARRALTPPPKPPAVLQAKAAPTKNAHAPRATPQPPQRTPPPAAPPAYRPQPTPRVLQRKAAVARPAAAAPPPPATRATPAAPPRAHASALRTRPGSSAVQPKAPAGVIQRAEDKGGRVRANVNVYGSLGLNWTQEELDAAAREMGREVHGHRSGGVNSGVSQQTETDMEEFVGILRKNKEKEKKLKKQQPSRDRGPMSDYGKADQKAKALYKEHGEDWLGFFVEYLDNRNIELEDEEFNDICKNVKED